MPLSLPATPLIAPPSINEHTRMSEKIKLWPSTPPVWNTADTREQPWLDWFPHPDAGERPCVLVLPGGGYSVRAAHEAEPIALAAHAAGYHAAVCHYRVQFHESPQALAYGPLHDAQRAIRILRSDANKFPITDNKIAVIGFSAGGHLCASTGVLWRTAAPIEDDLFEISAKPTAIAPCYPVITSKESSIQKGSYVNLLGADANPQMLADFSLENHIDEETPPIFLWHTADDEIVDLQNSLVFADHAQQHMVPVELHVFPHGKHGLALAEDDPCVGQWVPLFHNWLHRYLD